MRMQRRQILAGGLAASLLSPTRGHAMACVNITPHWEYVADTVMGGVSIGQITPDTISGRQAMRLTGEVSTENNGGFIQMAFNPGGAAVFDASAFTALSVDVIGNGELYDISLRTTDLTRPWQSYRARFRAEPTWRTVSLPFTDLTPNRTEMPFNPARLRRIGILALGRAFKADVAVANIKLCH